MDALFEVYYGDAIIFLFRTQGNIFIKILKVFKETPKQIFVADYAVETILLPDVDIHFVLFILGSVREGLKILIH